MSNLFKQKAPWVIAALHRDLDTELLNCIAILGNLGHESNGFEDLDQINGSAFGWPQWDGSRREDFFTYCKQNGLDRYSDEANYKYLVFELTETWERRVLPEMDEVESLYDKVVVFDKLFERSGIKHMDSRQRWARIALEAWNSVSGPITIPEFAGGGTYTPEHVEVEPPAVAGSVTVPPLWMPQCTMERIVVHWTAGRNKASGLDKRYYHIIMEGDGNLVRGNHGIPDNVSTADDDYAKHTRGLNTGSIGVSLAGMMDAEERPFDPGPEPLTTTQWDRLPEVLADLCTFYRIPVTRKTVLTHAEVQPTLGVKQRGKWDITHLPFDPSIRGAIEVGDEMRKKLRAELKKRRAEPELVEETEVPTKSSATTSAEATIGAAAGGAGAVAAGAAASQGRPWLAAITFVVVAVAIAGYIIWRRNRK